MLHHVRIIVIFFISIDSYSQSFVYSKDYFRWPVGNKPGIVANFGELREGHWHMGLDVRTDQTVNVPVYAAADGYISRISVHPFGYGQAIYIDHPNGLTTVYGHLNKFYNYLDSFVRAEQYKRQSWEIELQFSKDQFPIKKGQLIAYSGSTGSSQGPHVHFEIRDTKTERCINPLFFNLPIPDAVPPVFTKLAMYNRNLSIYDQSPTLFTVKKSGNKYSLKDKVIKTGFSRLAFAIGAYDCVTGSTNENGIFKAKIFLDGKLVSEFALDSMDYEETEYVNAHIDYKYHFNGGPYLQQLSKLPGDNGRAYRQERDGGIIILNDTNIHGVRIEISDVKQNTSVLNFNIRRSSNPDTSIDNADRQTFSPGFVNVFEKNDFELYIPDNGLYDSVQPIFHRRAEKSVDAVSDQFQFCNASIPIHGKVAIRIKPAVPIVENLRRKIVIRISDKKGMAYKKAEWQNDDWFSANFNSFGSFQAFVDSEPPSINGMRRVDTIDLSSSKNIIFYPKDNSGIKSFRAELDGKWLMFTNDKGSAFVYNFDERWPYGIHELKLIIEDIVGNSTENEWVIKRYPYAAPKKKIESSKKHGSTTKKKPTSKKK